jgi:hypothetical protein
MSTHFSREKYPGCAALAYSHDAVKNRGLATILCRSINLEAWTFRNNFIYRLCVWISCSINNKHFKLSQNCKRKLIKTI